MTDVILTRDWYLQHQACPEGYRVILRLQLLDQLYSKVIETLALHNEQHCIDWIQLRICTEEFVRKHGEVFTMKEQYRVFDPVIGQHIECVGEAEARKILIEISAKILEAHGPRVIQVIENEHGDHAWVPSELKVNIG